MQSIFFLSLCWTPARARALFALQRSIFGQPAGLSKEVCPYADAEWVQLICQSEGGERSMCLSAGPPVIEAPVPETELFGNTTKCSSTLRASLFGTFL